MLYPREISKNTKGYKINNIGWIESLVLIVNVVGLVSCVVMM